MKTIRQIFLAAAVSAFACTGTPLCAQTTDANTNKLSGTVIDTAGAPVAGATVDFWFDEGNFYQASEPKMEQQVTTGADGAFEFHVARAMGFLLARKSGFAPAWKQFGQPYNAARDKESKLTLTPPGTLAGTVLDQSNRPVANAEVSVTMAMGEIATEFGGRSFNPFSAKPARDLFSARTDASGHFRIENFPTNASAILAVRLPGKVLCPSTPEISDIQSAGYRVGDSDIRLTVEPAGSITGKIDCAETNQPLPLARLMLQPVERNILVWGHEPASSAADGTFRFDDVASGSYHVHAAFGTNTPAEWVAEPVGVSVETGQTARDVKLTATRGALLELLVVAKDDRKPQPQVSVTAYRQNFQSAATSDRNGIARLRLLPGDYQIAAFRQAMPSAQSSASVELGKTNRAEIEIVAPKRISGIVHTPDGKPATDIAVQMVGGFGPSAADVKTDASGKFELEWSQRQYPGQSDSTVCVLARDPEHNLAVAQDLDEETTNLDLTLAPGLTLAGRAEAGGKPLTNATAKLVFWTGRSGSWLDGLARTNTPGQFEIPALPPGRKYGVIISAPGYGQKQNHNLEISAEAGRQQLDTVEIKLANLKLAGQVLDADDKPVARCNVNLSGDDQPNGNTRTDRDGRFAFAHVCEGTIRLSANSQRAYGSVSAEGGDTNVVLRLGENMGSSSDSKPHKLTGVVTDSNDQPAAGVQVAVFPNNGARWTKTGTNGEYSLSWSLQSWQLQNGGAMIVLRDQTRDLARTEELPEETTNLNVKLKPALTFSGQVKNADGAPLTTAQVGLWLKAGNSYDQLNEQNAQPVNAEGRFEIKCLPPDAKYMVYASARGCGKVQQQLEPEYESNRVELEPFVLQLADRMIAGQILKDDDKPASGLNVNLNGDGQPDGNMTTDSQGRFHFQVCEGQIRLYAYSQSGGGNAQATVEAGDTNIVMHLTTSSGGFREKPRRTSLKGGPLPDLTSANLAANAATAGQPVLLFLFDAGQRPSRHVIKLLEQKAAALRGKNICVLGVQAAVTSDETFNGWKSASPVSFPVGRVAEKSAKTKWALDVSAFPWLILTDASHKIVAEGFSFDDLDAQVARLKAKS